MKPIYQTAHTLMHRDRVKGGRICLTETDTSRMRKVASDDLSMAYYPEYWCVKSSWVPLALRRSQQQILHHVNRLLPEDI